MYLCLLDSDDIDPASGAVDTNIITFDEDDILDKQAQVALQSEIVKSVNYTADSCSSLLELFHRSIEHSNVSPRKNFQRSVLIKFGFNILTIPS